jgi:hypothetical protein
LPLGSSELKGNGGAGLRRVHGREIEGRRRVWSLTGASSGDRRTVQHSGEEESRSRRDDVAGGSSTQQCAAVEKNEVGSVKRAV